MANGLYYDAFHSDDFSVFIEEGYLSDIDVKIVTDDIQIDLRLNKGQAKQLLSELHKVVG